MPTTVVKTIGTGGDYTTLQAWEDAAPANLVTSDQIWQGQVKNQTISGSTTLLTVSGSTTDATRYKELTTEAGASFRDNANVQTNALRYNASNGAAITSSSQYTAVIVGSEDFFRMSKLQIQSTSTASSGGQAFNNTLTGSPTLDIDGCILESGCTKVVAIYGSGQKIRNSLVVCRGSSRAEIANISNSASAINCTFVVPSDKTAATVGITGSYGTTPIKNCAIFGVSGVASGSSTRSYTTCYTNVASPPSGVTQATYNTSQFTNISDATRDYRIPSGSALIDTGTTDSTNAANDIAGTARPSGSAYDVGCWEFVAAVASNVFNILTGRGGAAAQPLVTH